MRVDYLTLRLMVASSDIARTARQDMRAFHKLVDSIMKNIRESESQWLIDDEKGLSVRELDDIIQDSAIFKYAQNLHELIGRVGKKEDDVPFRADDFIRLLRDEIHQAQQAKRSGGV